SIEATGLGFTGEEADPERLRLAHLGWHLRQHGETARNMEAAECDRPTRGEEGSRQVNSARELVRLETHERDQRVAPLLCDLANDLLGSYPTIRLVVGMQPDIDMGSKHGSLLRILGERVHTGQGVRWDRRSDPLNRVAVIIVVRWLDHDEVEDCVPRQP